MSHLLDLNVAECMLRCCEKEHDTRFSIADEICVIEEEIQWYCTYRNVLNWMLEGLKQHLEELKAGTEEE